MSIRRAARPSLKPVKTTSSLNTSTSSPTLTEDSVETKVHSEMFEEKSDEDMTDYAPSRPLSVAIPRNSGFSTTGPYCPRRPNLAEILANNSPPPWTLSAFMAYLSQNHCLETLEFTMDASRYRKHYTKMSSRSPGGQLSYGSEESAYVLSLWQKLLEAYIVPNGPREVNIPSEVRDSLVIYCTAEIPPEPSVLDIAVQKVYELMEESVLVPFLNSFYPQTALPDSRNTSQEELSQSVTSYDDRAMYRRSNRKERRSSPSMISSMSSSMPASAPPHNRSSAPSTFSQFARTLSHSTRHTSNSSRPQPPSARASSAVLSPWSSNGSEPGQIISAADIGLTDDNSVSSPSAMGDPMTPPNTPPQSDFTSPMNTSAARGLESHRKSEGGSSWKKMSWFKKKSSGSFREEELDNNGNFI